MSDAPVPAAVHAQLPADFSPLVERHFVPDGSDPFDGLDWKVRRSVLKDVTGTVSDKGKVIVPAGWSDNASDVLAQKYLRRAGVPSETEAVQEEGIPSWLSRSVASPGSSFGGETDMRAVARRMSGCWAYWGMRSGLLDEEEARALADDTSWLLVHQAFAPNSPQWFNTGLHWAYGIEGSGAGHHYVDPTTGEVVETVVSYERPQPQACFIQSVTDDLVNDGGIMDLWVREARLFKFGSGTGTNFSSVRGKGEPLSGGGLSSGLMSWLRIGDRSAAGIQSGGTTRRAAKMVVLDVDHPEIEDFVNWKPVEEQKVAAMVTGSRVNRRVVRDIRAAIEGYQSSNCVDDADRYEPSKNRVLKAALAEGRSLGVPDRLMVKAIEASRNHVVLDPEVYGLDWQGPAYDTVSGQQSNNSVSVPDAFMEAVLSDGPWSLVERTTGKVRKMLQAAGLFDQICTAAWGCADPGLQFVDTMNDWHTCAADGRIRGTNPCLPGFATMLTPDGIRPFSQIEVGSVVWSGKTWTKVVRKWSTGVKPVFGFHTRAGTFIGTEDHRVVSFGEKVEVREAETIDLCVGGAEGVGLDQGPYTSEWIRQTVMDGLMLGDGSPKVCNGGADTYLLLYVGQDDQSYFSSEISELFNHDPFDGKAHRAQTTLTAAELPKTYERTVPDRFFYGDEWTVRAFLRGLYSANGSVPGGRVSLKASSFAVVDRVQQMLSSLGIRSYYTTNSAHDVEFENGTYLCRESYDLNVSVDRDRFRRLIGFIQPYKQQALDEACSRPKGRKPAKDSYEVVRRDDLGEHEVFDFTVEDVEHVVWSQGLLVSNCAEYVFLDETACNLASLNLVQFLRGASFDLVSYERAVRHATTVLEISVAMASLPSKAIAKGTFDYRTLGLGYANLGALLMRMGIPYDSDEGRRVASAISSFTTAVAYDQSGRMARRVGPFRRWDANKDSMNRVLSNHRAVSRGEEAKVRIQPIRPDLSVEDRATALFEAANEMWDRAVSHAETGYRNAQVTCIAPTGTIALVMDCDTTGIEPDFSLVKHKTLAGGGFMKIVNQSVPSALRALGYNTEQSSAVVRHIVGAGRLRPEDKARLERRGVSAEAIGRIEGALKSAVHLRMAMLPDIVGREELARLQIDPSSAIPEALGFDAQLLEVASVHSTGHQTVEGCGVVKPEHLAVFDCANRCGKGSRFIRGEGHLRMLAAIQPFISGASSKTVNLPAGATVDEVRETYVSAWKSGVKCVALYVDGSKFSQPLSSAMADQLFGQVDVSSPVGSPESAEVVQQVVEKIVEKVVEREKVLVRYLSERRRLPNRRRGMTQKVTIGNHKVFLRTGEYDDGSIGEIFIDTHKDGTSFRAMMGAFAIAVSVGLQHGVPLERFVDLFTFTKFEPNGVVSGDDRLYMCTSLLDWIFRHLAVHYLGREDLATNPSPTAYDPSTVGDGEPKYDGERTLLDRSVVLGSTVDTSPGLTRSPFATVSSLPATFDPMLPAEDLSTDEVLLTRSLSPSVGSVEVFGGMQTVSSGAVDMGFEGDWCERCGGFSMVRIGRCLRCRNPDCGAESGGCG